jgi:hypothetical protein
MWFWNILGWVLGIWCILAIAGWMLRKIGNALHVVYVRGCWCLGRMISWGLRVKSAPTKL